MGEQIKVIVDGTEHMRRSVVPAPSIEKVKAQLPKSAFWHLRHKPYAVGNGEEKLK